MNTGMQVAGPGKKLRKLLQNAYNSEAFTSYHYPRACKHHQTGDEKTNSPRIKRFGSDATECVRIARDGEMEEAQPVLKGSARERPARISSPGILNDFGSRARYRLARRWPGK